MGKENVRRNVRYLIELRVFVRRIEVFDVESCKVLFGEM